MKFFFTIIVLIIFAGCSKTAYNFDERTNNEYHKTVKQELPRSYKILERFNELLSVYENSSKIKIMTPNINIRECGGVNTGVTASITEIIGSLDNKFKDIGKDPFLPYNRKSSIGDKFHQDNTDLYIEGSLICNELAKKAFSTTIEGEGGKGTGASDVSNKNKNNSTLSKMVLKLNLRSSKTRESVSRASYSIEFKKISEAHGFNIFISVVGFNNNVVETTVESTHDIANELSSRIVIDLLGKYLVIPYYRVDKGFYDENPKIKNTLKRMILGNQQYQRYLQFNKLSDFQIKIIENTLYKVGFKKERNSPKDTYNAILNFNRFIKPKTKLLNIKKIRLEEDFLYKLVMSLDLSYDHENREKVQNYLKYKFKDFFKKTPEIEHSSQNKINTNYKVQHKTIKNNMYNMDVSYFYDSSDSSLNILSYVKRKYKKDIYDTVSFTLSFPNLKNAQYSYNKIEYEGFLQAPIKSFTKLSNYSPNHFDPKYRKMYNKRTNYDKNINNFAIEGYQKKLKINTIENIPIGVLLKIKNIKKSDTDFAIRWVIKESHDKTIMIPNESNANYIDQQDFYALKVQL